MEASSPSHGSSRKDVSSSYFRSSSMIQGNSLHICVKFAQARSPAQAAHATDQLPIFTSASASRLCERPLRADVSASLQYATPQPWSEHSRGAVVLPQPRTLHARGSTWCAMPPCILRSIAGSLDHDDLVRLLIAEAHRWIDAVPVTSATPAIMIPSSSFDRRTVQTSLMRSSRLQSNKVSRPCGG